MNDDASTTSSIFDPRVGLATALHASPGVYALLLGSGVSTGAGVLTGWGVVQELVRQAATASGHEVGEKFDPEVWWAKNGDGKPLGYSSLLASLANTSAARRALLAGFFEPSDEDREVGNKVPGDAHRAIAKLVKRGTIRVILTTNFDRLLEQALEAEGIFPQVVVSPTAIAGMEPLTHASCTIIKLHGDYASLDQLNTEEELSQYESQLEGLLDRILDEYGLIVSGWSADWDTALVARIEAVRSRRYPLYWAARTGLGTAAKRLVAQHRASVILNADADTFFPDVLSRVEALDRMAAAPLTRSLAIAQIKRLIPDPTKYIELRDLLEGEVEKVVRTIVSQPGQIANDPQAIQDTHDAIVEAAATLLHMVANGVYFDRDRRHTDLWTWAVERLMRARQYPDGTFYPAVESLRHLPALLTLYAGALAAVATRRDDVLLQLLHSPTWREPFSNRGEVTAMDALHTLRVLDPDMINTFPRWSNRWLYPQSHYLRETLRSALLPLVGDESTYKTLFDQTEYRIALAQILDEESRYHHRPPIGNFIGDWQWDGNIPKAETDFRKHADGDQWGWDRSLEVADNPIEAKLLELREYLAKAQRY